jgi:hypothetical protein
MDKILLIIGVSIFGLLGAIHLLYTFFTTKLHPYDPNVIQVMKSTSLRLTQETTIWRAWLGFNASHSLGVMLFAAIYLPLIIFHFAVIRDSLWFSVLPVIPAILYLILAKKYWFKIPLFGILMSLVCFITSAWLINQ